MTQKPEELKAWEYFCDIGYYDLWAVRPVNDRSFNSQYLFHVQSMGEAQALCGLLNTRPAKDPQVLVEALKDCIISIREWQHESRCSMDGPAVIKAENAIKQWEEQ